MIEETVACRVVYCEGWDPASKSVIGPLSEATARRRDGEGAQYAVLLADQLAGERPVVLIEVCWASHHAAVWLFDEQNRRHARFDHRRLPPLDEARVDRLVLLSTWQWRYADTSAEFDDSVPYHRINHVTNGEYTPSSRNWPQDAPVLDLTKRVRPLPPFGEWARLVRVEDLLGHPITRTVADDPATEAPAEPPWQPPRPLRPRHLDEIFQHGKRFTGHDGDAVEVDVRVGPELWLPSGQLIVADPDPWMHEADVFAETVEPGKYPVTIAVARFADDERSLRVAAAKIVISERPVVSWETALRAGEDPRMLGDGEFYGVGVDAGCVALVDAEIAEFFEDTIEDHYDDLDELITELPEPESGANLIAVHSGWGDGFYPVWAGRADDGSLSCFVVDFLVLDRAEPIG